MTSRKMDLLEQKTGLIAYLTAKIKAGDWHAVQDAASDIREIDAKLEMLAEHLSTIGQAIQAQALPPQPASAGLINPDYDKWSKRLG